jgi:hypothetical protein
VLHGHGFSLWDVPQRHPAIFVVRDPSSRFTSGFYSRFREGRPRHYLPWTKAEARAFARFSTPNDLAEELTDPDDAIRDAAYDAMKGVMHVNAHLAYWLAGLSTCGSGPPTSRGLGDSTRWIPT